MVYPHVEHEHPVENKKSQPTDLLILLDGNAIIHRSFHAIRPLHTKAGEQTNAIFGFISILLTILATDKPKYIACAFDTKAPTFRHKQYADYKGTRAKAPDELYAQIPRIHQIIDTFNVPKLMQDGFEADDLIGTAAKKVSNENESILVKIITSDMDAFQLVNERICVADLHKGYTQSKCYFPADVKEKYGLSPEQIVDFKALAGDSSDNIPGVKGIGKKGATDLLQAYGSLDGIYNHLEEIKGTKQTLLREQKEQAYFSQMLATIKTDIPLPISLGECVAQDFKLENVIALFEELELFSLIKRLKNWKQGSGLSSEDITQLFGSPDLKPIKKQATPETQMQLF